MFCSHCGTQIPDGSAACANCGQRINPVGIPSDGTIILKIPGLSHVEVWAKTALIGGFISLLSIFLPFDSTVSKSSYDGSLNYRCNPSVFIMLIGKVKYTGDKETISSILQMPSLGCLLLCLLPIAIIACLFLIKNGHDTALLTVAGGIFGAIYTLQYMLQNLLFSKSDEYNVTPCIGMYLLLCGFVLVAVVAFYGLISENKQPLANAMAPHAI